MFKFLRKYNKWILAVGGTLLMIVFLIPQAIQGLSQNAAFSGAARATVGPDQEEVSAIELQQYQQELQFMDRGGIPVPGLGQVTDPWHWYLLVREAEQAGLVGGRLIDQLDPAQADLLRQNVGMSSEGLNRLMARINGISLLMQLYQTSGVFSDRRLRAAADHLFDGIQGETVIITASADQIDFMPSEADIVAQMEAHADQVPGEDGAVFGYRLPDRVKLEWIEIPIEAVRESIAESDALSGLAVRKHWMENASDPRFPPLPDTPATTPPTEVREDLLNGLTSEKMDEIARQGTNQLRSKTHGLPRREGYVEIPGDWAQTRLGFAELGQRFADQLGIDAPAVQTSDWVDAEAITALEGIGAASTDKYPPGRKTLATLVSVAKELQGSTTVLIQESVAGPTLQDANGSLYFFRIIETDPSRPPNSVDEVRQQVVEDLQRKAHFQQLVDSLPALETQAERDGLLTLALEHDTVVQRPQTISRYDQRELQIQTLTRRPMVPVPSALPIIGSDEATVEALLDWSSTLPEQVDALSEAERITAVPVEDALAVVLFKLGKRVPLTMVEFEDRVSRNQIQAILLNEELDASESITKAFSREALGDRHNLVVAVSESEEGLDPTTQPDAG